MLIAFTITIYWCTKLGLLTCYEVGSQNGYQEHDEGELEELHSEMWIGIVGLVSVS